MTGTTRAYLQNHILGVSEGHNAILRLVGVGFRATVEPTATTVKPEYPGQQFVSLKVGYSHPIELGIPQGVTASTPQPTRILLQGPVKEVVMQFAAVIRMWRKPEPYKGKGKLTLLVRSFTTNPYRDICKWRDYQIKGEKDQIDGIIIKLASAISPISQLAGVIMLRLMYMEVSFVSNV